MAASDSNDEARLTTMMQRWAEGKATLRDVRGYTDDELYAINPADAYFAKALGVVEMAAGNAQGALAAYDVALKLDARDAQAYVGRAEVRLTMGQKAQAVEDLRRAISLAPEDDPVARKASALVDALTGR